MTMSPQQKIKGIEKILGTKTDGIWGDDDKAAMGKLTSSGQQPAPDQTDVPPNPDVAPSPDALAGATPQVYR